MTTPAFPQTIYEGYINYGRHGWTPLSEFSESLGICACQVADEIGNETRLEWVVRRTDHNPDTGAIEASYFVDMIDAMEAGKDWCREIGRDVPHILETGRYWTGEDWAGLVERGVGGDDRDRGIAARVGRAGQIGRAHV